MIGGDAKLDQEHPIYLKYYGYMAQLIQEKCPEDLITAHINDHCNLDPIYAQSGYVDFYTYQSGHSYNEHSDLMLLAQTAGLPMEPMASGCFMMVPDLPVNIGPNCRFCGEAV